MCCLAILAAYATSDASAPSVRGFFLPINRCPRSGDFGLATEVFRTFPRLGSPKDPLSSLGLPGCGDPGKRVVEGDSRSFEPVKAVCLEGGH